ncbi:MAG: PQQ-binding-like beta-propeller repeat protein [Pirellulaceae bacterium]|nr:PQQ-binding-like beta-propeller repeat protein [Pirellulaceae bacterium]
MRSTTEQFLNLLSGRQLLPDDVLTELRDQVAQSSARLTPELIARLLVEHGHLTKFQATRLVAEAKPLSADSKSYAEELGLVPESGIAQIVVDSLDETDEVQSVDQGQGNLESSAATRARLSGLTNQAAQPSGATDSSSGPPTTSGSEAAAQYASLSEKRATSSVNKAKKPAAADHEGGLAKPSKFIKPVRSSSQKNPWDSFRIVGVALLLSLVGVAGFFLITWMLRGNATDALQRADTAYEQRSYETSASMYRDFAQNWPAHASASYAKVRQALSLLRKDVEGAANPQVALKTAESVLPPLPAESALREQQSDLAGAMITLAEKFTARIDATPQGSERRALMADMDKLMNFIQDPQLVGATQRTQLAPTLQRIEESRLRIQREIQRDDELALALSKIDEHLQASRIDEAHEVRKQLIARYPQLESHEEIKQRVLSASALQRDRVHNSTVQAQLVTELPGADAPKAFVFAHAQGRVVSELEGARVYFNVKGSVYGVDAQQGNVLWRRYVGLENDWQPIRLSEDPGSDVLICQSSAGRISRLAGDTGVSRWTVQFGEPVTQPAVSNGEVFASTQSGAVLCLDAVGGQTKWAKQLPQSLEVGPGIYQSGQFLYQPAGHSNIYVLDRRQGDCHQVYYLGHREGAIRVAPVVVLGNLLACENINNESARIRILSITDQGLQQAQPAVAVDGNVLVPALADRRQALVQSDLGNTLILEVDPSATARPVTVVARVPKNLDWPQNFGVAFGRNQVWLAEKRLARLDLVVSQEKLNRKWSRYEGDQFAASLQLWDKYLFHARRPSGSDGLMISASMAEDGEPLWEVEVGSPVTLVHRAPGDRIDVVLGSGNYYVLAPSKGVRSQADSSLSDSLIRRRLTAPVWPTAGRSLMLNQSNPRELVVYNASSNPPISPIPLALGSAQPASPLVVTDQRVVVGLDNGQLVQLDSMNGQLSGDAFQPTPIEPGTKVEWIAPTFVSETQSLIVPMRTGSVHRVSAGDSLRSLSEQPLDRPWRGPLAVVKDQLLGVRVADVGDEAVVLDANSLQVKQQQPIHGGLISGPYSTSRGCVLQTDRGLIAFNQAAELVWELSELSHRLAGPPVETGELYVMSCRQGQIWVVDAASGQVLGSTSVGQPLNTPPLILQKRILVGGDDGVVWVVPVPTQHLLGGGSQ